MSASQLVMIQQVMNSKTVVYCPTIMKIHVYTPSSFSVTVSPMDYGAVDIILMFAVCEIRSCVDVSIVDDMILEKPESFNVTLKRTPDLDSKIILDPVSGVVEITDNDGK